MAGEIERRREAFRIWVRENGPRVPDIAEKAGVPITTLYSYLGGKTQSLKGTTQETIANAYGMTVEEVFGGKSRLVPVVGFVGAGDAAHYYEAAQGPFDYVDAPEDATFDTVAGEVKGQSIGRLFDGWLIFWNEVHSPVTTDQHGQLCVVGLPDGRVLVKWLQPARDGRFHLLSQTEDPIFDQEVAWAAKVVNMRPR